MDPGTLAVIVLGLAAAVALVGLGPLVLALVDVFLVTLPRAVKPAWRLTEKTVKRGPLFALRLFLAVPFVLAVSATLSARALRAMAREMAREARRRASA